MKRLIPFLVLLVGATSALPQAVDFSNIRAFTATADRRVYDVGGMAPLVGGNYVAGLWFGPQGASESSLTPITTTSTFRNVPTSDSLAGTWTPSRTLTLAGMASGQIATLQVRAWDTTGGTTFDNALRKGSSATFSYMIPPAGAAPSAFYIENFRSFSLVPEPSVIGLGLLGAGALLLLRRRK
jgi:hypothetical protein